MSILEIIAAANPKIDPSNVPNIPTNSAFDVLGGVLSGIYMIVGAVAVIVIILSGFSFASASYDPAKVAKAKNAILYSVVGLIVVIIAFAITQFIIGELKK
jgi:heme O synthase-like polyprenyltransferase